MWSRIVVLSGLMGLVIGCGSVRGDLVMMEKTGEATGDAAPVYQEALGHWEQRGEQESLTKAIALWEEAATIDPSHLPTQNRLTYAYYFQAHAHDRWLEDEDAATEAMMNSYLKGMEAGARALKLASPEFADRIQKGEAWSTAIEAVDQKGLHAMYWHAANLGKWGLLDSIATILKYKDRAFSLVQRVYDMDKTFGSGAAPRYFGAAALKVPVGKDPEKSLAMFTESMEIAPNYLDTKLLYAEFYLVYQGEEAEFKKTLEEIVGTADDVIPDRVPETKNAKRIAQSMLDNMDDFF